MALNRPKRVVSILIIAVMLLVPMAAFASSIGFVYDFSHVLYSQNYSLNGSDLYIHTNTTYYSGSKKSNDTFTIDLYRHHWYGDSFIAYRTQNRYGSDTAAWYGVGSATYNFTFSKSQDGQVLKGTGTIHN